MTHGKIILGFAGQNQIDDIPISELFKNKDYRIIDMWDVIGVTSRILQKWSENPLTLKQYMSISIKRFSLSK